ncbi:MAG: PEP-CTERM sorting domain-containing protein [Sedimentisphaerales bacterium]|nr:PEP-CTERM sorting domain-containing protein [Sedimentisphaerales bacterium]
MTKSQNVRENVVGRLVLTVVAVLTLLVLGVPAQAYTITNLNPEDGHMTGAISRNGVPIPNLVPTWIYGDPGQPDHRSVTDNYLGSQAYSGSSAGWGVVSQHIWATSPVGGTVGHTVSALAYETTRMVFTQAETGLPKGWLTYGTRNLVLDGFLSITKNPDSPDGYKGLSASFSVDVTRHWVEGGAYAPQTMFTGTVNLMGLFNGAPYVYTTGNISTLHISAIEETEDTYKVYFDEVSFTYPIYGWVGTEFDVRTRFISNLTTLGNGTGAEVKFGPDQPLPSEEVPEPATVGLLAIGGFFGLLRNRKLL